MRLSYAVQLLGDRPLTERLQLLVRAGLDGVDLPASALTEPDTHARVRDSGLPVGAVYSQVRDPGLLSARNSERAAAVDQIVARAEAAAGIGASVLIVVPLFGEAKLSAYETILDPATSETAVLLAGLTELAERVRDLPLTITLEPLNPAETHFLTDPTRAAQLCRAIDSPHIATMVDTYHCHRSEQDISEKIADVGVQLSLVHLSDSDRRLPGEGSIDFAEVLRTLDRRGYAGWLGLECKHDGDDDAIVRSVAYLRSLREQVQSETSPDQDGADDLTNRKRPNHRVA